MMLEAEEQMADDDTNHQTPKSVVIGSHLSFNYKEDPNPSGFICGSCCAMNTVTLGEAVVRCRECGYRILYKARQRRPLVYYAR